MEGGSVNSQNKAWANDKTKFGYKMLCKMGWTEGKGLGLKENGIQEHIRTRKKCSNAGIGIVRKPTDAWNVPAKVAQGLNDVLARLAPISSGEGTAAGAAEIKRADGGRGYYGRRASQKNVAAYSETALREIFGGGDVVEVGRGLAAERAEKDVAKLQRRRLRRERKEGGGDNKLKVKLKIETREKRRKEKRRKEKKERKSKRGIRG